MSVDRCICRCVPFRDFLSAAGAHGPDFALLQNVTGLGTGCGMCVPYAMVALRTGRAGLPVMRPADFERVLGPSWQESVGCAAVPTVPA